MKTKIKQHLSNFLVYRSRPAGYLEKKVLSFLSSIETDKAILPYDLVGTQAHVLMLYNRKYLSSKDLKLVAKALQEAKRNTSVVKVTGFEDIHEAIEAFVISRAGVESGGKMHTGRSRNDQVALDLRMKVRDEINSISFAALDLVRSISKRASENQDTIMPLYTHMQQAQVGTLSHYLISQAYSLLRDIERLTQVYERINKSPLGAGAIAGTSLEIDRMYTARTLGFDGLVLNSLDATGSRDVFAEFVSCIAILMSSLSRIAEDFVIWSTSEFGFIELADKYSSTSSAMPQKKNPDPLEVVRGKAGGVIGDLVAILSILKSLPSGYNRDLQELKPALFRASEAASTTLDIMKGVMESFIVNREKLAGASSRNYVTAIDVAEHLVKAFDIPFRVAHKIIGAAVIRAISRGNILLGDLSERDIEAVLSSFDKKMMYDLNASKMLRIMRETSARGAVDGRRSAGSPHRREQKIMLGDILSAESKYRTLVAERSLHISSSFDRLQARIDRLLKEL